VEHSPTFFCCKNVVIFHFSLKQVHGAGQYRNYTKHRLKIPKMRPIKAKREAISLAFVYSPIVWLEETFHKVYLKAKARKLTKELISNRKRVLILRTYTRSILYSIVFQMAHNCV
jgi:hypothetical protein